MAGTLDKILHPSDQNRIIEAIKVAERQSSGELKVHVEARCPGGDAVKRAQGLFRALGLTRTKDRNAVLIYVAVRERRFTILGDTGIAEGVGSPFWAEALQRMNAAFGRGAFGDGIVGAIQALGPKLGARFPRAADDRNEIDNEITTDDSAV
jgi:uncharacterized membrane protein